MSFEAVIAEETILSNSMLVQANFKNSKLKNVNFNNSDLTGAFFQNTDFHNVSFKNSILVGADFSGSNVTIHDLEKAQSLYAAMLPVKVDLELKQIRPDLFNKRIISYQDSFINLILEKHSKHIFK